MQRGERRVGQGFEGFRRLEGGAIQSGSAGQSVAQGDASIEQNGDVEIIPGLSPLQQGSGNGPRPMIRGSEPGAKVARAEPNAALNSSGFPFRPAGATADAWLFQGRAGGPLSGVSGWRIVKAAMAGASVPAAQPTG
jgi:hypothetical protein